MPPKKKLSLIDRLRRDLAPAADTTTAPLGATAGPSDAAESVQTEQSIPYVPPSLETPSGPIEGPLNWPEAFPNLESLGQDYRQAIDANKPLLENQLQYLRESEGLLSNIEFISKIGGGCFGQVWKVSATKTDPEDEPVVSQVELAAKILLLEEFYRSARRVESMQDMLRDWLSLKYIKHDNICRLIDMISIPDSKTGFPFVAVCLFLELCDGDLEALLQSTPNQCFSELMSKQWFHQIANGLAYLHQENVVHLDLKANNIIYKFNGNVETAQSVEELVASSTFKICDFGFAIHFPPTDNQCLLTKDTQTGIVSAPEVNMRFHTSIESKPCDVHSLGFCLAKSVLGSVEAHQLNKSLNFEGLVKSDKCSEGMANLMGGMMDRYPQKRPTMTEVLNHVWLTS